jgi:hypothetical protein
MKSISKIGTLIALSAAAALWGTGCAAEVDEQGEAELASVDESADTALESLAVADESADVSDSEEGATSEDEAALTSNDWDWEYYGGRRIHRRYFNRDISCGGRFHLYDGGRYYDDDCYRRYFDGDCGGSYRHYGGRRYFGEGCFDSRRFRRRFYGDW